MVQRCQGGPYGMYGATRREHTEGGRCVHDAAFRVVSPEHTQMLCIGHMRQMFDIWASVLYEGVWGNNGDTVQITQLVDLP